MESEMQHRERFMESETQHRSMAVVLNQWSRDHQWSLTGFQVVPNLDGAARQGFSCEGGEGGLGVL